MQCCFGNFFDLNCCLSRSHWWIADIRSLTLFSAAFLLLSMTCLKGFYIKAKLNFYVPLKSLGCTSLYLPTFCNWPCIMHLMQLCSNNRKVFKENKSVKPSQYRTWTCFFSFQDLPVLPMPSPFDAELASRLLNKAGVKVTPSELAARASPTAPRRSDLPKIDSNLLNLHSQNQFPLPPSISSSAAAAMMQVKTQIFHCPFLFIQMCPRYVLKRIDQKVLKQTEYL